MLHSTSPQIDELFTPAQVAEMLSLNIHTVYRLIRTRRLPAVALSPRNYRVKSADLASYLDENMTVRRDAPEDNLINLSVSDTTPDQEIDSMAPHAALNDVARSVTTPKQGGPR